MSSTTGRLDYSTNNSGGYWWLKLEDWLALESAAWIVHWYHDISQDHGDYPGKGSKDDPHTWKEMSFTGHSHHYGLEEVPAIRDTVEGFLGTPAHGASKRFATPEEGVAEWESLTGADASDQGCNCCGSPHHFQWEGDDGITRYPSVRISYSEVEW